MDRRGREVRNATSVVEIHVRLHNVCDLLTEAAHCFEQSDRTMDGYALRTGNEPGSSRALSVGKRGATQAAVNQRYAIVGLDQQDVADPPRTSKEDSWRHSSGVVVAYPDPSRLTTRQRYLRRSKRHTISIRAQATLIDERTEPL